jgi:hypothetical protein
MNPEGKGVAVMAYTITDLFRAARYVARAAGSLYCQRFGTGGRGITGSDASVAVAPSTAEYGWIACDSCGAWVGTELIGQDGAGYTEDDSFYCSSCRWGDDCMR